MEQKRIKIGEKEYLAYIADTPETRERGLMGVEELEVVDGLEEVMLFDFGEVQPEVSFWMYGTLINLDISFIGTDMRVLDVVEGEAGSKDEIIENNVLYVLETNPNSGIKKGDLLVIEGNEETTTIEETGENSEIEEDSEEDQWPELEVNKLYVIGSNGQPQAQLEGGERIFSRKSSRVLIRKAKKAFASKSDVDYKALGRYLFNEMKNQDQRPEEFVEE